MRDTAPELSQRATRISGREDSLDSPESIATATIERSPLLEVSNAMVGLYKEAFGRGPTKARAQFAGNDTLLVTLESSLTVAERNLVAMGEHQRLREARLFLSHALEDQFRGDRRAGTWPQDAGIRERNRHRPRRDNQTVHARAIRRAL